ncbi:MAG: RDD family protein [Acidimicrobiales bacterium]
MPYCNRCGNLLETGQQSCPECGQASDGALAGLGPMPRSSDVTTLGAGTDLASYWWRVLGYLVDAIILGVVVSYPLRSLHVNAYAAAIVVVVVTFFYGTLLLTYTSGQTLGMRLVRVRVVNATTNATVSRFEAGKRTALYCVFSLISNIYHYDKYRHPNAHERMVESHHAALGLVLGIPIFLDLLWPLWDKRKQTLTDKFAGTVVVRPRT